MKKICLIELYHKKSSLSNQNNILLNYTDRMNAYHSDFIGNLIYYREQKGYTQSTLAAVCDCSKGNIGGIESGKSSPSFELILKIAYALEIHPADLFLRNTSNNRADAAAFFENEFFPMMKSLIAKQFPQK